MEEKNKELSHGETAAYRRFGIYISVALILCFASIFFGMAIRNRSLVRETLLERARSLFQEIVLTRVWNSNYGGVYVVKGKGVESNPWLLAPDLEAKDGRVLTLRNPAQMTREISEITGRGDGFRFHSTSLRPLNPANIPDAFERSALGSFESGKKESWETIQEKGGKVFHYMAPLVTEESCLKCHAFQGYKAGQIRGGISISFPVDDIEREERLNIAVIAGLGILVCAIMLAIIFVFFHSLRRKLDEARAELRDAAIKDGLTGLYNRRFALGRYEEEFAKAKRTGAPLSLAIVDADDFKRVNDQFGHLVGDAVLRNLAAILREGLRPYDLAGRYGGEEFLLLFPAASTAEALVACERIRKNMESGLVSKTEGLETTVTISIGIASIEAADTPSALLGRADMALYRAKAAGKNRCEIA